mgnify:CR=1 FL=1
MDWCSSNYMVGNGTMLGGNNVLYFFKANPVLMENPNLELSSPTAAQKQKWDYFVSRVHLDQFPIITITDTTVSIVNYEAKSILVKRLNDNKFHEVNIFDASNLLIDKSNNESKGQLLDPTENSFPVTENSHFTVTFTKFNGETFEESFYINVKDGVKSYSVMLSQDKPLEFEPYIHKNWKDLKPIVFDNDLLSNMYLEEFKKVKDIPKPKITFGPQGFDQTLLISNIRVIAIKAYFQDKLIGENELLPFVHFPGGHMEGSLTKWHSVLIDHFRVHFKGYGMYRFDLLALDNSEYTCRILIQESIHIPDPERLVFELENIELISKPLNL